MGEIINFPEPQSTYQTDLWLTDRLGADVIFERDMTDGEYGHSFEADDNTALQAARAASMSRHATGRAAEIARRRQITAELAGRAVSKEATAEVHYLKPRNK